VALELEVLRQRRVEAAADQALHRGHVPGRPAREAERAPPRGREQLLRRDDLADQTLLQRALGGERGVLEQQPDGPRLAHEAR
jgi:hypothetical protein